MVKGQILEGDPSWYLPSCTMYVSSLIYEADDPFSVGPDADPQNPCECIHLCTHNRQKDTLKNITNSGRNLEIILECKRLAISVGNVKEESSMFKKPTCSVINHFVNTDSAPGPMLCTGDVEMKGCNPCPGGPLH